MSAPCILITRPEPDASETARLMEHHGYRTERLPILNIRLLESVKCDLFSMDNRKIQVIALTSAHALSCLHPLHEFPLAVVGSTSETKARALGFADIRTAGGNATALLELITSDFSPEGGLVLYPRGRHTAFDLAGALRSRGFDVREIIAYDATPIEALPPSMLLLLEGRGIHAVSIYSARTLHVLEQLILKHRIEKCTKHILLICLSAKIAKEATFDLWQRIVHADAPEDVAMLDIFKRLYGAPPHITT